MKVKDIRNTFFEFFQSKGHAIVPSAPLVIKNDPTLMFTNAGMNQFKELFLGISKAKNSRIADTQKCLRVSGKHNDLEEVGVDTYHHTMFEMLGNWSFGDYFKKEAIEWAWELLTEVYKIDKSRIYVTIFEGDKEDGLEADNEAKDIWKKLIAEDRILPCSKKDNFWEMGETGPCGPCSEIHVDIRSEELRAKVDGKTLVNNDHPQVIEIWNLVFIQFNRLSDRSLQSLPDKHIDTGMGLERLAMVLQGKQSNYDSDIFMPLIDKICSLSGKTYAATNHIQDVSIRVISDHVRAVSFSIADGQLPSNTGAGYVIRRILRRAIRYGYSFLDMKEAFISQLVPILANEMGEVFPELKSQKELIQKVIKEEEESFLRTLEKGIHQFKEQAKKEKNQISGSFAFELYDTFGFPIDLTELMAREDGLTVDMVGFEKELQQQKERSRAATKVETGDWVYLLKDVKDEFVGYDHLEASANITQYRKVTAKGKEMYQLVFDKTPFYPEGGGQVGDTGIIEAEGEKISIIDTKKENNQILHFVEQLPKNVKSTLKATVNSPKRTLTESNHSATHLLHEALREVLGTHVEQKGSLVNSEHLRFDFSHFQKVSDEEIKLIEKKINEKIRANFPLNEKRNYPIEKAKEMGAMALFGEKYGDAVRVIQFGSSVELCGGCHTKATGSIGLFKIKHESAVAAGIRRIEAITSTIAETYINSQLELLNELKIALKSNDLKKSITELVNQKTKLEKELEVLNSKQTIGLVEELAKKAQNKNGVNFIAEKVIAENAGILRDLAFQLEKKLGNAFILLGADLAGKANLTAIVSKNLTETTKLHAGNIIKELSKEIQGGGGGQATFATSGGSNPKGIEAAFEKAGGFLD